MNYLNIFNLIFMPACVVGISSQSNVLERDVGGLAEAIVNFANINLGANKCQEHFDQISHQSHDSNVDASEILKELKKHLETKTEFVRIALEQLHRLVLTAHNKNQENRESQSCCTYDDKDSKYDPIFQTKVNADDFCEKGKPNPIHIFHSKDILSGFKTVYKEIKEKYGRDIFYGGADGYSILYPARSEKKNLHCTSFDPRFQEWYKSTLNYDVGKDVVLILDFTKNMKNMEQTMRYVVKLLLSIVDTKDRLVVKLYNGSLQTINTTTDCLKSFALATPFLIEKLQQNIHETKLSGIAIKYVDIFRKLSEVFDEFNTREKKIVFLTSGNYVDKETNREIKDIFQQSTCQHDITTMIILLGSFGREYINFHEELTQITCHQNKQNTLSVILKDDSEITIRNKLATIWYKQATHTTFPRSATNDIHFTMPYGGNLEFGVLINACRKVLDEEEHLLGVLCVSLITNQLVGGSSDVPQSEDFHRFLTDTSGTTFMHLNYFEPSGSEKTVTPLEITRFETSQQFQQIYSSIKRGESGNKSFLLNTSISRGSFGASFVLKNYTYYWTKVENSDFVIGVVISSKYRNIDLITTGLGGIEKYHRLDLWKENNQFCTVGNEVLAKDSSVIKFAPGSFERPSIYSQNETEESIKDLMKFFGKTIDYVPPPTLFRGKNIRGKLRESVISTHFLQNLWINDTTPESSDILLRYIGMESGMFRAFPGKIYHQNYDPRVRGWYRVGVAEKDKIVISSPYLGASTQSVVLTLSKAIFIGKGLSRQVIGVIGMDFILPLLKLLVQKNLKGCQSTSTRCVLIDNSGFVIYHEQLMTKTIRDGETIQLAEFEPRIVDHLIASKHMKRKRCVQYSSDGSSDEWFYSLDDIEKPIHAKVKDLEYWITSIPGTNVFVLKIQGRYAKASYQCSRQCSGIFNESCACLNQNVCLSSLVNISSNDLICKPVDSRNTSFSPHWYKGQLKDLHKCSSCGRIRTKNECEDRLFCQWCLEYSNGSIAAPNNQYCALSDSCFPEQNPNYILNKRPINEDDNRKYVITIGVTCAIIVLLIVVVIILLLKRNNIKLREQNPDDNVDDPRPIQPIQNYENAIDPIANQPPIHNDDEIIFVPRAIQPNLVIENHNSGDDRQEDSDEDTYEPKSSETFV